MPERFESDLLISVKTKIEEPLPPSPQEQDRHRDSLMSFFHDNKEGNNDGSAIVLQDRRKTLQVQKSDIDGYFSKAPIARHGNLFERESENSDYHH